MVRQSGLYITSRVAVGGVALVHSVNVESIGYVRHVVEAPKRLRKLPSARVVCSTIVSLLMSPRYPFTSFSITLDSNERAYRFPTCRGLALAIARCSQWWDLGGWMALELEPLWSGNSHIYDVRERARYPPWLLG